MTQTSTYQVTGMTCGHCEAAVRTEVTKIDGVRDVAVDAGTGVLAITSDAALTDDDVLAAVDEAGYEAVRSS
ncbi:heavy-metal-associated domain-containing protein [Microbacterium aurantiacum]|uniref:heavy-metal-associated domain-containing protein n=1 Tax=Microbacterium aurantiacum TaxID=162393 RepID=UPI001F2ED06A|nr:heavy metal-associated domain-containing protein [Microbacterium aurantiacum]